MPRASSRRRNIILAVAAPIGAALLSLISWLLLWPVPIEPRAWHAPPTRSLDSVPTIAIGTDRDATMNLGGRVGPETLAPTTDGGLVTATACGSVLRFGPDDLLPTVVANTGGRPLGIVERDDGALFVADALRGLLRIDADGTIVDLVVVGTPLPDGNPLGFPNSVALDALGRICFTDASSRFAPARWGLDEAVFLDLIEHGGSGRLLRLDQRDGAIEILLDGLHFANGVALAPDGQTLFVCETGLFRVLRVATDGDGRVHASTLVEHLPGFPDNIAAGDDGRYWIGLVADRSGILDLLSSRPFLRRVVARIPSAVRPGPSGAGSAIAVDVDGRIVKRVRDTTGRIPQITSILERDGEIAVGTLSGDDIPRIRVETKPR